MAEWFAERSVVGDGDDAVDIEIDVPDGEADEADEAVEAENGTADVPDEDDTTEVDAAGDDGRETFDDTDLDQVRGIGPAYAERLRSAGVTTVSELAAADAEALADRVDVAVTRVEDWIDNADELVS